MPIRSSGGNLSLWLKSAERKPWELQGIARQLLYALLYVHDRGVTHRVRAFLSVYYFSLPVLSYPTFCAPVAFFCLLFFSSCIHPSPKSYRLSVSVCPFLTTTTQPILLLHHSTLLHTTQDIKPSNVLMHEDGRVVLADFEFSREIKVSVVSTHPVMSYPVMARLSTHICY